MGRGGLNGGFVGKMKGQGEIFKEERGTFSVRGFGPFLKIYFDFDLKISMKILHF